jgi:hypothetical protein
MRHSETWRATRQRAQLLRTELRKEQDRSRQARAAAAEAVRRSKFLLQSAAALRRDMQRAQRKATVQERGLEPLDVIRRIWRARV